MNPLPWQDPAATAYTDLGTAVYGAELPYDDILAKLRDALANVKLAIQILEAARWGEK